MKIDFHNRYHRLSPSLFERVAPTPVEAPRLIVFNRTLADELGIDHVGCDDDTLAQLFSGNRLPAGSDPIAMAYMGHQFGHFNPGLGDGRAILLGQVNAEAGRPFDIQLKGSGRTAYSRNGDGRSALGPVLREYLVSEAMHRMGVPTTRALAAVTTGEQVARERLTPGGVFTRVSNNLVRVGTFQSIAYREDRDALVQMIDYCIQTSYPELTGSDDKAGALLAGVIDRQASLIARWMCLGFIHGVMNTDNMSIAGETIDYGPCAFMDAFAHDRVYSSIDHHGRYAYNQQPNIAIWNLSRLAETLLPELDDDEDEAVKRATQKLENFAPAWQQYWLDGMRNKLGILDRRPDDRTLVDDLLKTMAANEADFTLTFHHLTRSLMDEEGATADLYSLFNTTAKLEEWLTLWRIRLTQDDHDIAEQHAAMQHANPVYIPRNHQIEVVIRAAEDRDDLEPFHRLNEVLSDPMSYQIAREDYMLPPRPEQIVHQTFCGT